MPADKRMQQIGAAIKQRREYLRLSQQDIAERMQMGRSTYAHYETGYASIAVADLERLARILRVPISYFFGELPADNTDPESIQSLYNALPPDLQEIVLEMVKAAHRQVMRPTTPKANSVC
jgi:transcriptional regulator with XRE-family HTH domain